MRSTSRACRPAPGATPGKRRGSPEDRPGNRSARVPASAGRARPATPGPSANPSRSAPATHLESDAGAQLARACETLSLVLTSTQQSTLLAFGELLLKWNAVYNLTALRDPHEVLVQHLFDCLAVVEPLTRHGLRDGAVVVDVGAGGGLPGVVLAICVPDAQVHCVDTVGKKVAFLRQVRAELGLPNLHAHHARVESLRVPADLPPAQLVLCRAFSSLADFVSVTAHLLAGDGLWAAMKGALPDDEIAVLPASVRVCAAITLGVPQLDARRHLLLLERVA